MEGYSISEVKDLTNKMFGRWLIIKRKDNNKKGRAMWLCECQCENKTQRIILGSNLIQGKSKSCGCLQKEIASDINKIIKKKYNTYDLSGDLGVGYTFKGEEFYFDLEDYDKIKDYCWMINKQGYVVTYINNHQVKFHNFINDNTNPECVYDHKNHIKHDNQKNNLRLGNQQQNSMNKVKPINNTSSVVGVTWHKRQQKWNARIGYKNKLIYLGSYIKFDDAVKARKEAEDKYYGEYSYDNSMKLNKNKDGGM
jgi:hypothetical protein